MTALTEKVALVTGGATGIGRSTARVFAREGARVVIADQSDEGLAVAEAIIRKGGVASFIKADVSSASDVENIMQHVLTTFGQLNCAFNNAGVPDEATSILESDDNNWERQIAVNMKGVMLCMKAEIPLMLRSGGGAIVNTASRAGLVGVVQAPIYSATKHGVVGLTKSVALEFAPRGIRINAVCPGLIDTPLLEKRFGESRHTNAANANPLGRLGHPEEIAEAVVWLCSDAASFVVGIAMPVDGGACAR